MSNSHSAACLDVAGLDAVLLTAALGLQVESVLQSSEHTEATELTGLLTSTHLQVNHQESISHNIRIL